MNKIELTAEEELLHLYISDALRIKTYTAQMKACRSLKEAEDRVLIPMIRNEGISLDIIARKEFYSRLKPFLKHIKKLSRTTLWNHFTDMAELLKKQKDCDHTALQSLFSGGIELMSPKLGEEAHYTIEVVITASEENSDKLLMSALLTGVECRKVDIKNFDGERMDAHCDCSYCMTATLSFIIGMMEYMASLFDINNKVDVQYKSEWVNREQLTLEQAIQLAKSEIE